MVQFVRAPCNLPFFFPKVTLNHGRPVPAVLLANKSDQLGSQQPKLDSFCRENGFVGWFETSAKVRERRRRTCGGSNCTFLKIRGKEIQLD